jgi:hypothetical protein
VTFVRDGCKYWAPSSRTMTTKKVAEKKMALGTDPPEAGRAVYTYLVLESVSRSPMGWDHEIII